MVSMNEKLYTLYTLNSDRHNIITECILCFNVYDRGNNFAWKCWDEQVLSLRTVNNSIIIALLLQQWWLVGSELWWKNENKKNKSWGLLFLFYSLGLAKTNVQFFSFIIVSGQEKFITFFNKVRWAP